ncbi:mechanosensitive ion channel family protein [Brevibacterium spongiae]|uniref:Mechanosensitive ion channel family protein n=1 Tax=Brevibacterium spongiae TaxID=2909672 RepID=A0ABY5SU55_9MICO|nr:mechanosensitive ion channel family protein [Brevibacterium spongiae]UVI37670.1 mechanosensitive ion channel family protein [Brevibacterium spongiae]
MTSDAMESTVQAASDFDWSFLLGAPLRITVIIIGAIVINLIVRLFIRRFTTAVAKGTVGSEKAEGAGLAKFSSTALEAQRTGIDQQTIKERRAQRAKTVGRMLSSVTTILLSAIAALMILDALNFNIAPILASAGIAGVAIAFGAQELVRDYLSGFFIVIEDQYGIGDTVDLGEAVGEVEDVGLRRTQVRDLTGTLWHVRNGEILRVGNLSQGWARAVLDIPIDYRTTMDDFREMTEEITRTLRQDHEINKAMLENPEIAGVQSLSGSYRVIRTMIKTKPNQQWLVERAFRAALMTELAKRGGQIGMVQETVLRTLPDAEEADSAKKSAGSSDQRNKKATVGAASTARSKTAAADEKPSSLPSDDEIRSTVQEDSPSEGSDDDADS